MRESAERGGPLPRVVVGAPVVLLFVFIFVVALAHDRGALVEPGGGRSLFRTRLAMASVVEQIPLAEKAFTSAVLIMHGLMTVSILVFLAALGRRRHRDFFGSRRRLKALLFCTFLRMGTSVAFAHSENHLFGLASWGISGLTSLGMASAFAKEAMLPYPSRWKSLPIFLGNYKHIPVAGYSIGGLLSILVVCIPPVRHLVEPAWLAVLFGDLASVHRAWCML